MLLETEERIRFGCWLCWVVFGLYEDFKLEYERIRIQEEKEDSQKVFKYSKSRYCDASGNKEGNLGSEVCEQCLERQESGVGCSSSLWGVRGDCDFVGFK